MERVGNGLGGFWADGVEGAGGDCGSHSDVKVWFSLGLEGLGVLGLTWDVSGVVGVGAGEESVVGLRGGLYGGEESLAETEPLSGLERRLCGGENGIEVSGKGRKGLLGDNAVVGVQVGREDSVDLRQNDLGSRNLNGC